MLSLPRQVTAYEFSILNSNILFDLELPLAWTGLTIQEAPQMERLWMYKLTNLVDVTLENELQGHYYSVDLTD